MGDIRPCRDDERGAILAIVDAAAEAYRGVIPADRWRKPYMPLDELDAEIADGVVFWGHEVDGELAGIMGIQDVGDFDLIRHAYVSPERQRRGLRTYWTIPERQVETSVVLAKPGAECLVSVAATARLPAAAAAGRKRVKLGSSAYAVKPGGSARARFRLTTKGRGLLRRFRRIQAKIAISVTRLSGGTTRKTATVRLKAPRRTSTL